MVGVVVGVVLLRLGQDGLHQAVLHVEGGGVILGVITGPGRVHAPRADY